MQKLNAKSIFLKMTNTIITFNSLPTLYKTLTGKKQSASGPPLPIPNPTNNKQPQQNQLATQLKLTANNKLPTTQDTNKDNNKDNQQTLPLQTQQKPPPNPNPSPQTPLMVNKQLPSTQGKYSKTFLRQKPHKTDAFLRVT